MFKFFTNLLKAFGKIFVGVPWAVFTTATVGTLSVVAAGVAAAGVISKKTLYGKKYLQTDQDAQAVADFLFGIVKGTWGFAFSGIVEIASDLGKAGVENKTLASIGGITDKVADTSKNAKDAIKPEKAIEKTKEDLSTNLEW